MYGPNPNQDDLRFSVFLEKFVLMSILAVAYYFMAMTIESVYNGKRLKIPEKNPSKIKWFVFKRLLACKLP